MLWSAIVHTPPPPAVASPERRRRLVTASTAVKDNWVETPRAGSAVELGRSFRALSLYWILNRRLYGPFTGKVEIYQKNKNIGQTMALASAAGSHLGGTAAMRGNIPEVVLLCCAALAAGW